MRKIWNRIKCVFGVHRPSTRVVKLAIGDIRNERFCQSCGRKL
jgi:hypothetical protein